MPDADGKIKGIAVPEIPWHVLEERGRKLAEVLDRTPLWSRYSRGAIEARLDERRHASS